jgi:hypothetical protein
MVHLTSTQLKRAGLALLTLPILILGGFAVGELPVGDISGLQHVVELVLVALLAWLAWRRPLWGGMALIALALILLMLYIVFIHGFPLPTVVLTLIFLFATPLAAGVLFVAAARQQRDGHK